MAVARVTTTFSHILKDGGARPLNAFHSLSKLPQIVSDRFNKAYPGGFQLADRTIINVNDFQPKVYGFKYIVPVEQQLRYFYQPLAGESFFKDLIEILMGRHPDETYLRSGIIAFVSQVPSLIGADGQDHSFDVMRSAFGPTLLSYLFNPKSPFAEADTDESAFMSSLRRTSVIGDWRSATNPFTGSPFPAGTIMPKFNNWHCTAGLSDMVRELSVFWDLPELESIGLNPATLPGLNPAYRVRGLYERLLKHNSLPRTNDNIIALAKELASQGNYRDFNQATGEVLINSLIDYCENRQSSFKPTKIFVFMGVSGSGKTTLAQKLVEKGTLDYVIPVMTDKDEKADFGEEKVSAATFNGRLNLMAGVESGFSARYGVSENEIIRALKRGGNVAIVAGPDIFGHLREFLRKLRVDEDSVVAVRSNVKKEVLEKRLKERERETGRPAAGRIKEYEAVNKYLDEKGITEGRAGVINFDNSGNLDDNFTPLNTAVIARKEALVPIRLGALPAGLVIPAPLSRTKQNIMQNLDSAIAEIKKAVSGAVAYVDIPGTMLGQSQRDAQANKNLVSVPSFMPFLIEVFRATRLEIARAGEPDIHDYYPFSRQDYELAQNLSEHLLGTVAGVIELNQMIGIGETNAVAGQGGVAEGLRATALDSIVKENRAALDKAAKSVPVDEQIRLAILHDLGKLDNAVWSHWHAELSAKIIEYLKAALMRDVTLTEKEIKSLKEKAEKDWGDRIKKGKKLLAQQGTGKDDIAEKEKAMLKQMNEEVESEIKKLNNDRKELIQRLFRYHHHFGDTYQGRASFLFLPEMLEDTGLGPLLGKKGNIDAFLDRLLLLTVVDVASMNNLNPIGLNHYAKLRKALGDQLKTRPYQEVIDGLRNGTILQEIVSSRNRLGAIASFREQPEKRDLRDGTKEYYKKLVLPVVRYARLSAVEWSAVIENLQFIDLPYFAFEQLVKVEKDELDHVVSKMVDRGDPLTVAQKEQARTELEPAVNVAMIKFFKKLSDEVEKHPEHKDKIFEFVFVDQENKPISFAGKIKAYRHLRRALLEMQGFDQPNIEICPNIGDEAEAAKAKVFPAQRPENRRFEVPDRIKYQIVLKGFTEPRR